MISHIKSVSFGRKKKKKEEGNTNTDERRKVEPNNMAPKEYQKAQTGPQNLGRVTGGSRLA